MDGRREERHPKELQAPPLQPGPLRPGPGHFARSFLQFRKKNEVVWEVCEAVLVGTVFLLMFLGADELEYFFGLFSHALVGILLTMKFLSLGAAWWVSRHPPGIGLD